MASDPVNRKLFSSPSTAGEQFLTKAIKVPPQGQIAPPPNTTNESGTADNLQVTLLTNIVAAAKKHGPPVEEAKYRDSSAFVRDAPSGVVDNSILNTFKDADSSSPQAFALGISQSFVLSVSEIAAKLSQKFQLDKRAVATANKIMTKFIGGDNQIT